MLGIKWDNIYREHTLTKIFSPYIQEVVAGRPTVLPLAPFSVPLCYQGVSWVTQQQDCTTIHWLIVQYSPRQLAVTKQGCSSSMVFHCEYTGTSDPFTCKTPCPQTTITVERACMYHKYSEMTSHCNHDPYLAAPHFHHCRWICKGLRIRLSQPHIHSGVGTVVTVAALAAALFNPKIN